MSAFLQRASLTAARTRGASGHSFTPLEGACGLTPGPIQLNDPLASLVERRLTLRGNRRRPRDHSVVAVDQERLGVRIPLFGTSRGSENRLALIPSPGVRRVL